MIFNNSKQVSDIKHNTKGMTAIYHLSLLVWQNLKSCFGKGYWDSIAPWSDTEGWKD